jgi:2',3'-cyclic-nucleotide 2'-phosphodiesterase/3'-nucleotidase/5'-nucleotidase
MRFMKRHFHFNRASAIVLALLLLSVNAVQAEPTLNSSEFWRYRAPSGASEIAAYCADTERLFVTVGGGVDVVSVRNGTSDGEIPIPEGFHATSVACQDQVLAIAWAADDKRLRGRIVFYDATELNEIASHSAGYLPDMITFTPDGETLLAANEGEPTDDYSFDPEASVSLITKNGDWKDAKVREASFQKFNSQKLELIKAGVRVFGPRKDQPGETASVAEDVEPEYIAVRADSQVAWVTLQENNAIAEVDVGRGEITAIHPVGLKSFRSLPEGGAKLISVASGTGLDASDQDGGVRIRHWPISGMYQPDGIATFQQDGQDYLVTANEGDPRDYIDYCEAIAVSELAAAGIEVDPSNPARYLLGNDQLGRLEISRAAGDNDGDGDLDEFVTFGTRSFSIWKRGDEGLELVFDSGNDFEQTISQVAPQLFNTESDAQSPTDVRSVSRGPEPENIVVFELGGRRLAAIGLERTGGVMLYDVSRPREARFLSNIQPDEAESRDLAPEGLLFIAAERNPTRKSLLVLCNEGSGTMTAYALELNDSN